MEIGAAGNYKQRRSSCSKNLLSDEIGSVDLNKSLLLSL